MGYGAMIVAATCDPEAGSSDIWNRFFLLLPFPLPQRARDLVGNPNRDAPCNLRQLHRVARMRFALSPRVCVGASKHLQNADVSDQHLNTMMKLYDVRNQAD